MSKCLRCGAGSEWLQGKIPDEQVTPSCDNPTTVELKYDPTLEVPQEIIEAAYKIGEWTTRHGWKNWEIGPVADRSALAAERGRAEFAEVDACELRQQLAAEREKVWILEKDISRLRDCTHQGAEQIKQLREQIAFEQKAKWECVDKLAAAVEALRQLRRSFPMNDKQVNIIDAALAKISK